MEKDKEIEYQIEETTAPNRDKVEMLGTTYEAGKPEGEELGKWRQKLADREEKLKYLQTGERYWYGKDWYGSEKRKNPA
jgi:hypothetical protein